MDLEGLRVVGLLSSGVGLLKSCNAFAQSITMPFELE